MPSSTPGINWMDSRQYLFIKPVRQEPKRNWSQCSQHISNFTLFYFSFNLIYFYFSFILFILLFISISYLMVLLNVKFKKEVREKYFYYYQERFLNEDVSALVFCSYLFLKKHKYFSKPLDVFGIYSISKGNQFPNILSTCKTTVFDG